MKIKKTLLAVTAYFGLTTFLRSPKIHGHDHHGHGHGGVGFGGHPDLQAQAMPP